MNIIEQIQNQYKENGRLAVLIRHADRDKIPEGSFGNEIPINQKGMENALSLGIQLQNFKVNKIYTSPVNRCIQSAEQIIYGYNKPLQIIQSKALGDPGLNISDEQMAGEIIMQYGVKHTYQKIIDGENIPGFVFLDELRARFMDFFAKSTEDNGITLFISHDLPIALFHYSLNKTIYTHENWVGFLSGMVLNLENSYLLGIDK